MPFLACFEVALHLAPSYINPLQEAHRGFIGIHYHLIALLFSLESPSVAT